MKHGVFDCSISPRQCPARRRVSVRIGCGAGFAGDRPVAALKLLERVPDMDYLVLECLAERTFAARVEAQAAGAPGFDPRISEWMQLLLPVAAKKQVCIITNMGAVDPLGAQAELLKLSSKLSIEASVAAVYEHPASADGSSTYLGAAPIVRVLEQGKPHVIITSRLADASLFLGPMVHELGWNWDDYSMLAQGALAGHLLECGCQLTGGYYMHPADPFREFSLEKLLNISLPYADVFSDGRVVVAKAEGSGGEINFSTCTQQLLYEVDDPACYITPDVILDIRKVSFKQLSRDKVLVTGALPHPDQKPECLLRLVPSFCGWKGWGEISYGGNYCEERAKISDQLVRAWMDETYPGLGHRIHSYMIGKNSLFTSSGESTPRQEVRLRLDGLFDSQEQAAQLAREVEALYTNGPAGGGGISSGYKKEIRLEKQLITREQVSWRLSFTGSETLDSKTSEAIEAPEFTAEIEKESPPGAPAGALVRLYQVAHSRTGDKGNTLNFSLIPHRRGDIKRLQEIITVDWVKQVFSESLGLSEALVSVHLVEGVSSLNVVVRNALDGGVTCSRRIDRHGKSLSDLILQQQVRLP